MIGKVLWQEKNIGCFKPGDGDCLVNLGRDSFGLLKERRNNTNEEELAIDLRELKVEKKIRWVIKLTQAS